MPKLLAHCLHEFCKCIFQSSQHFETNDIVIIYPLDSFQTMNEGQAAAVAFVTCQLCESVSQVQRREVEVKPIFSNNEITTVNYVEIH